jgi:hypothetical protein
VGDPCLLIIDASLSTRLGTELRKRGREAVSLASLRLKALEDEPMLRALAERYLNERYVLVTADDAMPATHGSVLDETATTLATLDGRWKRSGLPQETYKCEVVHRWAHVMAAQKSRTIHRYSIGGHRLWTLPRGR